MLSFAVTACTTAEKYSFTRLGQTYDQNTGQLVNPAEPPKLSDGLALNFASSVATAFRAKFNGTRVANEVATTVQVTLAALAGAGAAFDFGSSAVAALGLSSAGIPQLQRIFMVQGRIDAYQDAVRLIEEAEIEYLALNQYPSSTILTQNGVTLFQRVTASIHLVEKTLGGRIPSLQDTEKATEPMTQAGAKATLPGSPAFNNLPANPRPAAAILHPIAKTPPVVTEVPLQPGVLVEQPLADQKRYVGSLLRKLTPEQAAAASAILDPQAPPVPVPQAQEQLAGRLFDATTKSEVNRIEQAVKKAKAAGGTSNDLSVLRREVSARLRQLPGSQAAKALAILKPGASEVPAEQAKEQLAGALADAQTATQILEVGAAIEQSQASPEAFADQKRRVGSLLRKLTPEQAAAALAILNPQAPPVPASQAQEQLAGMLFDATTKSEVDRIEEVVKKAKAAGGATGGATGGTSNDLSVLRREVSARLRQLPGSQAVKALAILKPGGPEVPPDQAKEQLAGALADAQTAAQILEVEAAIEQSQTTLEAFANQKRRVGSLLRKLTPEQAAAALATLDPQAPPVPVSQGQERLAVRLFDATTKSEIDSIDGAVQKAKTMERATGAARSNVAALRREVRALLLTLTGAQAAKALTILQPSAPSVPPERAKEQLAGALADAQTVDQILAVETAMKQAKTSPEHN
jgi:hypothetical protein